MKEKCEKESTINTIEIELGQKRDSSFFVCVESSNQNLERKK